jgi:hypothetical protein
MAGSVVTSASTRTWYEICSLTPSVAQEILVCPLADKVVS